MFSKSKPSDAVPQPAPPPPVPGLTDEWAGAPPPVAASLAQGRGTKSGASILASDLTITGNIHSSGDIQVEGTIEGDVRATHLTVGESATIKGEIAAEEVIVQGRVTGRLRGLKVHLTASARVEGDIVHKTIAIESGAHFEGSVQRQDDPVGGAVPARLPGPHLREARRGSAPAAEPAE